MRVRVCAVARRRVWRVRVACVSRMSRVCLACVSRVCPFCARAPNVQWQHGVSHPMVLSVQHEGHLHVPHLQHFILHGWMMQHGVPE